MYIFKQILNFQHSVNSFFFCKICMGHPVYKYKFETLLTSTRLKDQQPLMLCMPYTTNFVDMQLSY